MVRVPIYEYRRRLPHFQRAARALFVTFRKLNHDPLPERARDIVLQHCLYEHGKRIELHAAVVMPDHVHLLFTPLQDEQGWPIPVYKILKGIKGTSARRVNQLLHCRGPVWQDESFDHVLRSNESQREKIEYIRMNPVRKGLAEAPQEYKWLWVEPRQAP
jgi:REP element-mobilizing transposase RayT